MQTKINKVEVLQFVQDNDEFLITYYAKKHNEIITRRGTWRKPIEPNKNIEGKVIESNGNDVFIYWDLDATPNKNGNKWRHATNPSVERINNGA